MLTRNILIALVCASTLTLAGVAIARNDKGGAAQNGQKAHEHHHNNGHDLLSDKLKHNGKHQIAQLGTEPVVAEVTDGKVVNMTAGALPVHKYKSKHKMAGLDSNGMVRYAANGEIQLAQNYNDYYYAYCFDDGYVTTCYWYPSYDVVVTDSWYDYPV